MDKVDPDENRLIAERRRKLTEARERGVAFPNEFRRDVLADQLHANFGERSKEALDDEAIVVRVGGRMMVKRVMGKTSFVKLQDRSGQIQLMIARDRLGEEPYRLFKTSDLGDIFGAEGTLFKTKTGELSVRVERLHPLVKSLRPLPDKWHGLTDQEQRYRRRYVDLIVNEEARATFKARTRVIAFMRSFLDALGFMEVETPMMQPIPGGAVARPFVTHHNALDMALYLRIAPELYLKRLLVGGMERVYEINRSFRNEGLSTQHNPEFTMLELYQAYADYREVMEHAEAIVRESARTVLGTTEIEYQGVNLNLTTPFRRLTVADSLLEYGADLDEARLRDVDYLRGICEQQGLSVEAHWQAGKLQVELFDHWVEPKLEQPTFVTQYPAEVSPLARRNDEDPFVTDRFELFIAGREIANGFSELNDPEDQAARFADQVNAKTAGDDEAMFFDHDYIRALEYGMPPAGGLGIGIDRLVMLLTNSASIRDVLLFPHLRREDSS